MQNEGESKSGDSKFFWKASSSYLVYMYREALYEKVMEKSIKF